MKFKVPLFGQTVLVSGEQLERILEIVDDCDTANEEWVGPEKGTNGTSYMLRVATLSVDKVNLSVMMDDTIETLRLATKLYDQSK